MLPRLPFSFDSPLLFRWWTARHPAALEEPARASTSMSLTTSQDLLASAADASDAGSGGALANMIHGSASTGFSISYLPILNSLSRLYSLVNRQAGPNDPNAAASAIEINALQTRLLHVTLAMLVVQRTQSLQLGQGLERTANSIGSLTRSQIATEHRIERLQANDVSLAERIETLRASLYTYQSKRLKDTVWLKKTALFLVALWLSSRLQKWIALDHWMSWLGLSRSPRHSQSTKALSLYWIQKSAVDWSLALMVYYYLKNKLLSL